MSFEPFIFPVLTPQHIMCTLGTLFVLMLVFIVDMIVKVQPLCLYGLTVTIWCSRHTSVQVIDNMYTSVPVPIISHSLCFAAAPR